MSTAAQKAILDRIALAPEVRAALDASPRLVMPETREDLYQISLGPEGGPVFCVDYEANGKTVTEATVVRCRNGIAVNYPEDYMRRRDPQCMHIADDLPTDKNRYTEKFGKPFAPVRQETLDWLGTQELVVVPFKAGALRFGSPSLAIVPVNAAFFALTLCDLPAGSRSTSSATSRRAPSSTLLPRSARPTSTTSRWWSTTARETLHEIFAYNLYPGPSAKKGVFSVLLDIGEKEGEAGSPPTRRRSA